MNEVRPIHARLSLCSDDVPGRVGAIEQLLPLGQRVRLREHESAHDERFDVGQVSEHPERVAAPVRGREHHAVLSHVLDAGEDAAGAVVQVVDGNDYIGEFTVSGGEVDVSSVKSLTSAEIGFNFDVTLKTNPIDINAGSGPVTGIPRGIGSVIVDLNNTLSCSVNGTKLIIRNVTDDMSQQQIAFTGKKEFRLLGYSRDPQVTITQTAPLPIQVNGLVAELIF